ncbi:hypothetical protein N9M16_01845 [Candidatus Dependentiae bacterium]|nr:hypothetical protein [Candidatus Dependentiae bacterium]
MLSCAKVATSRCASAKRGRTAGWETTEWQQDGYTCRPLQDANLHGLSTAWTFDECVAKVQPPTDANIIEVEKTDGSTHFDYRFATEADDSDVLSAYDNWRGTAVLQASGGDDDW